MPKARDSKLEKVSVGEHSICVECMRRLVLERMRKANVGISNDKGNEIFPRRKTEVSRAMSISPGSVGS